MTPELRELLQRAEKYAQEGMPLPPPKTKNNKSLRDRTDGVITKHKRAMELLADK